MRSEVVTLTLVFLYRETVDGLDDGTEARGGAAAGEGVRQGPCAHLLPRLHPQGHNDRQYHAGASFGHLYPARIEQIKWADDVFLS